MKSQKYRVLLIEDNPADANLIKELLAEGFQTSGPEPAWKFDIDWVTRLSAGCEKLRQEKFDLVLMDLLLPDGTGLDNLTKLQADDATVPIVVMTGLDDEDVGSKALAHGAQDYLDKGMDLDPELMAHVIRFAIERNKWRKQLDDIASQLKSNEGDFVNLVERNMEPILVADTEGVIQFFNAAFETLIGRTKEELKGTKWEQPLTPGDHHNVKVIQPSGMENEVEMRVIEIQWEGKNAYLALFHDVTEYQKSYKDLESLAVRLEELAFYDTATQLPNKQGLYRLLLKELANTKRHGTSMLAILIEIPDLVKINETHGHGSGDMVLKELVSRMRSVLRATEHLGRISGNKFLTLAPDVRLAEATEIAEKMRAAVMDHPVSTNPEQQHLSVEYGIAAVPPGTVPTIDEVIALGRLDLKRNKFSRLKREGITTEEMTDSLCKGRGLHVVTLPIYRLEAEELVGYELLSRGPEGSFFLPEDFFRLSRKNGVLSVVDQQCFRACMKSVATYCEKKQPVRFHVNIFPSSIVEFSAALLTELPDRLDPSLLCIEVSEQQLLGDPEYLLKPLRLLKETGVRIAVDNVGFGYTCLESLVVLEPDIIKIDRRCVKGIGLDSGRLRLLKRLLRITQSLGTEIIANGIETNNDLQLLKTLGVKFGQGYYWGKPIEF